MYHLCGWEVIEYLVDEMGTVGIGEFCDGDGVELETIAGDFFKFGDFVVIDGGG